MLSLKTVGIAGDDYGERQDKLTLKSDAGGRFQAAGKTGRTVIIDSFSKEGYIPGAMEHAHFNYEREDGVPVHIADPVNSGVFKMWQRHGKADLIVWESPNRKLSEDGTTLVLDLIARKFQSASHPLSDIRLKLEVGAQVSSSPSSRFPWKLALESVSGGILPTNDEFMFQAPQTGYVSNYTLAVLPSDAGWPNTQRIKCYYIAANGNIFGRFELKIIAIPGANDGIVAVKSAVNMNGSTNLEP